MPYMALYFGYYFSMNAQRLQLYRTIEHDCGYLPGQLASNLVPDPQVPMNMPLYSQLIQHGYRRSGSQTYRPYCYNCHACIACRILVAHFKTNRNQRRCLKYNQDLRYQIVEARYTEEYFLLYQEYLNARHGDGSMASPDQSDFTHFLYGDWSDTLFLEVRKNQQLLAVAVCDITTTGLSAVYTFFDPQQAKRSLGSYCILKQIELSRTRSLDYLYMGYWIKNCQKMQYKTHFKPMEFYIHDGWQQEPEKVEKS